MELRRRDLAALAIAAVSFALGLVLWSVGRVDPGMHLGYGADDNNARILVVDSVQPGGLAAGYGVYAGAVVVNVDGNATGPGHDASQDAALAEPQPADLGFVSRDALAQVVANDPSQLVTGVYLGWARGRLEASLMSLLVGLVLFGLTLWWLATGRAGPTLRPLAVLLAVAGAAPLFLLPAYLSLYPLAVLAVAVLLPASLLPLAEAFAVLVPEAAARRWLRFTALSLALAATAVGTLGLVTELERGYPSMARWALASAVVLVPGIAAARPLRPGALASGGPGRIVESTDLAVAATLPPVAMIALGAIGGSPFLLPLLVWVAVVLAARRFTIRPLARLAASASLQRDLVVAATEAERARIAADIHDDALQDLTMLVRRLDAAGDEEGAAMARTVADRLRAICGDLRLPILDDLGAGPALEWLVERIARISGGQVRLERDDEIRAPAEVELAVFRVAQEALSNAVRHGRPPIVVRYRSATGWAALSVDDAGPGIEPDASERAQQAGHFGLLGMAQRAEQIGAILDVRRWPAGGTHVALEWRAR